MSTGKRLYWQWVAANAAAELIGLGATFALDIGIMARVSQGRSLAAAIAGIVLIAATGAVEGTVVGLLQWAVLRQPFPGVARHSWAGATVAGAVVAWFLGSLPSTLMDFATTGDLATAAPEPPQWMVLLLAAGMGLFLGLVLGYPQWRVLRRHTAAAWIWLPANALAWAAGMPVIFAAVDRAYAAYAAGSIPGAAAIMAVALALAGAAVGAVHGLALVRLAARTRQKKGAPYSGEGSTARRGQS